MHWTLTVSILLAVAEAFRSLPGIIWAIRCPADSPNYVLPRAPTRLLGRRSK
jgi:hypothetical protein